LPRLTRVAALSIARHRGSSAVAIATLGFMLTALTIFILLANGLGQAASGLESKAELVAYLNQSVDASGRSAIVQRIETRWPGATVQYVSPDQALRQFRRTPLGRSITSAIEGNPLPGSLNVRTPNPLTLNQIAGSLSANLKIHNVVLNRNLTDKLVQIDTVVTVAGTALVLGLALLALIMVVNTTHLSIEARKKEIEVVRVMGATQAFVRNPLIVEGIMLGLAGSLLAAVAGLGIFLPLVQAILAGSSTLSALLPITSSADFIGTLTLCILLVGGGIGALGSYVSAQRFAGI
jgi:cell division transport system permease protein